MNAFPFKTYDTSVQGAFAARTEESFLPLQLDPALRRRIAWVMFSHSSFAVGNEVWMRFSLAGNDVIKLPVWLRPVNGEYVGFAVNGNTTGYMQQGSMTLIWNPVGVGTWFQLQPIPLPNIEADKVDLVVTAAASGDARALLACASFAN